MKHFFRFMLYPTRSRRVRVTSMRLRRSAARFFSELGRFIVPTVVNVRWVIRAVIVIVIAVCIIAAVVIAYRYSVSLSVARFLERHPNRYMLWDRPRNDFDEAIAHRLKASKITIVTYTIEPGYHFWKIANERGITVDTIIGSNPFLTSITARVGDIVYTPDKRGVLHYVQENESIAILSAFYNTPEREIREENRIPFGIIKRGDVLFIPGARPRVLSPKMAIAFYNRSLFSVPTDGWVRNRGFGMQINPFTGSMQMHNGIDMKADSGTPIFSAAEGTVKYAGPAEGYGILIIVEHSNRFETYYGHCSKLHTSTGKSVKRRQIIGRVGETGRATTPHLHFEIRSNGRPIDPMQYLW